MKKNLIKLVFALVSALMFTSCKDQNSTQPVACFTAPEDVIAGEPAAFSSSCSQYATSYVWDFGDGGSSSTASPSHTFQAGGSYTVSLTIMDSEGNSDETSQSVTVTEVAALEHSGPINADETWIEGVHRVTGDVYVNGATLTIEPGVTVIFSGHTGIYLGYYSGTSGATLIANGTDLKPITFTAAGSSKSAGDWDFIGFYSGSSNNSSMQYCNLEYGGGYSNEYGEIYLSDATLSLDHSSIRFSPGLGVCLENNSEFSSFTHNTISNVGTFAISVEGNFAHSIGGDNTLGSTKGVYVKGDEYSQTSASWLKLDCPYVLGGDLYINSAAGAELTLMPGVELQLMPTVGIYVGYHSSTYGTLIAEGTANEHITITSAAPEASRGPGDWDYIGFYQGAGNTSSISYCDISYGGGYGSGSGMIYLYNSEVSIVNSTITGSEVQGIVLEDAASFSEFTGNVLGNHGEAPIRIYGNYVHTIGQGNSFTSGTGILVKGDVMEQTDVTWYKQDIPYIIDGSLYIQSAGGAKLTLEPGTTVQFNPTAAIYIAYNSGTYGRLVADGTPEDKITFTSSSPEGSQAPGDWYGIFFYDGTGAGTLLDNCVISYGGGYGSNSGNLTIYSQTAGVPVVTDSEISHSSSWGIYQAGGTSPTLSGITYSNNTLGNIN
jgi:PKD repeat protein